MVVVCALDQVRRAKRVEFVDLHIAAEPDVPIEPFLEYAVPQSVHFGNRFNQLAVIVCCNQLHHGPSPVVE
jgi:hypothetical protein